MSHLTIYRASAGSGKTFTLTREYLALLLNNADYHRRILAVTFTNKATEEMKSRIVRNLHEMANRKDEQYICEMAKKTGKNENELPNIALKALTHLLHDYSHFSVSTIDSFFQKVIRSFAREMGLYAGYNVELDQNSVLDEATNLMLADIDKNNYLKDWLVKWAERKIEEGKSWNVKSDVLQIGNEIFSEELQNFDTEILKNTTNKEALERYRVKLQNIVNDYWSFLQHNGQKAMSMMNDYGLTVNSFFQKAKGVGGYFLKFAERKGKEKDIQPTDNSYIHQALEDIEGWYSKSSPQSQKKAVTDAYEGGLNAILQEMNDFQKKNTQKTTTAVVILKQLTVLGVLCDLMDYVKEYTRDQNLFLLSEASGFLKTIIANADAPFIYERVGNFYNHFMIDEFQDTSTIQWENFRPLIENSIASGYRNWIVGDVKQSIYRWRNTDWKILSEQVEQDLGSHNVQVQNLDRNWRSTPEIVQFNNAFFREAVAQMRSNFLNKETVADEDFLNNLTVSMDDAYSDYFQHLPERQNNEQGYVCLSIIVEEKGAEEKWRDKALMQLPRQIEKLQDLGYGLSDIAILVRENKEAQAIADMFLKYRQERPDSKYRYDVLSNESLLIGNSPVVKWLVAAMRYIVEPDDMINRAYLQYEYQTYFNSESTFQDSVIHLFNDLMIHLRGLPVYELSDKLIHQYHLYQYFGQAPFLQAFQDILLQYSHREATDIRSFLNWWESEKSKKYVTMPDNQDAIRLITIHKSKGLEFDAVIIPFCDWSLCKFGKTLWCQPDVEPFNDMNILPLKFEKELHNTIFVKEYLREKIFSYIDNLNLLYVAFTRARKVLFISTPQQTNDEFTNVKDLIYKVYQDDWMPDNKFLEFGVLTEKKSRKDETTSETTTYFIQPESRTTKPSTKLNPKLYFARNSAYFATDGVRNAQIDKGKLLHDIFRNIVTIADLERCLNAMIVEGKLPEAERTHIVEMVHRALDNPVVSRWFTPGLQVKTETEILFPDGNIARPDRIVFDNDHVQIIDYKFGEFESKKNRQQMICYIKNLREMGYTNLEGFLWYVTLNKVEKVVEI